jgi:hypothetical protein
MEKGLVSPLAPKRLVKISTINNQIKRLERVIPIHIPGIPAQVLTPIERAQQWSALNPDRKLGALYLPKGPTKAQKLDAQMRGRDIPKSAKQMGMTETQYAQAFNKAWVVGKRSYHQGKRKRTPALHRWLVDIMGWSEQEYVTRYK